MESEPRRIVTDVRINQFEAATTARCPCGSSISRCSF
jgi:hypothetical protein